MSAGAAAAGLKTARAAWAHRDAAAALAHLRVARAGDLDTELADIGLLQAEVLHQSGQLARADKVLAQVQTEHPDDFRAPYHRARLAHQRRDTAAAWAHLGTARANDGQDRAAPDLLEADILRDIGRPDAARAVLRALVARHPRTIAAHQKLAALAEAQKDPAEARTAFEAAVDIDPDRLPLQFGLVRQLQALGDFDAAIARLETLRARHGPQPEIMMALVRACRMGKQAAREADALAATLALHPRHPPLLRHMFATRVNEADPATLEAVLDLVRRKQGTDLADALEIPMQLQRLDFKAALRAIRSTRRARRSPAEAQGLLSALFGAHRYRLAWRYLQACLRRWPGNPGFWGILVHQGGRLGQADAVARRIEAVAPTLPAHLVLEFRLTLCGYRDDLAGAVDGFAALTEQGLVRPPQRWLMHKMIFNLASMDQARAFYDRFGAPAEVEDKPLHRVGLPGSMAMEFQLEAAERDRMAEDLSLRDWTLARPDSSVASIRYIDAWRTGTGPRQGPGADAVPRRIVQYWDAPDPPPAIADMVASWAGAPGVEHRLYDRRDARAFLRETFGKTWVQAFDLANNAAQEADLLRLAVLARAGGIWADADDVLYGDLTRILNAGPGLIVGREAQGGALGNNFLAAPPDHPVIVHAAQMAVRALNARSADLAWFKTGPGLLTRAVGLYLARTEPETARSQVTILNWPQLAREIATHNPATYKSSAGYWNRKDERGAARPPDLWDQLLANLQAAQ